MTLQGILAINKKHHQNITKYSKPINNLCRSLHIRIYDVTEDNRVLILDNNIDYLETYIDKKCYKYDPHLTSCSLITTNHFILWPSALDNNHNAQWIINFRQLYNIGDGITVIRVHERGYRAFTLCSNKIHENTHRLYYNYHDSIQTYIELLENKIKYILDENIREYVDLNIIRDNNKNIQNSIVQNVLSDNMRNTFLQML